MCFYNPKSLQNLDFLIILSHTKLIFSKWFPIQMFYSIGCNTEIYIHFHQAVIYATNISFVIITLHHVIRQVVVQVAHFRLTFYLAKTCTVRLPIYTAFLYYAFRFEFSQKVFIPFLATQSNNFISVASIVCQVPSTYKFHCH